jgi:hypothetical protein
MKYSTGKTADKQRYWGILSFRYDLSLIGSPEQLSHHGLTKFAQQLAKHFIGQPVLNNLFNQFVQPICSTQWSTVCSTQWSTLYRTTCAKQFIEQIDRTIRQGMG